MPAIPLDGERPVYFPQDDSSDEDVEFWKEKSQSFDLESVPKLLAFKYIDDTTIFLKASLDNASRHLTTGITIESLHSLPLEPVMEVLKERSETIGMRINEKKTQVLVISPPNGCNTTAAFEAGGIQID